MGTLSRFAALIARFRRSRAGNVAIIASMALPALIGFCGLGSDIGYWYYRQRVVQAAADIAAYNATVALRGGATTSEVESIAASSASDNGWNSAIGTITVNTPPDSGSYQNAQSVEVILKENEPRYFTAMFSSSTVPENSRAVATFTYATDACMLALNKNASGAMTFWGNASADFTDCNVVSNSLANDSFKLGGSANVSTPCVRTAGEAVVSATLSMTDCDSIITSAPQADDPYASLPAPTIPDDCASPSGSVYSPGKYCGGLSINSTATLQPGVYVIDGGTLKLNASADISGTGVTFYLTNGATLSFNGNATLDLTAPTSGTYAGVLMFGDRTQSYATNTINGNSYSNLTGAIYFPSQDVRFLGNFGGSNGCLQVVASTIYYTGSASFHSDCAGTGMGTIKVPGSVTLVE